MRANLTPGYVTVIAVQSTKPPRPSRSRIPHFPPECLSWSRSSPAPLRCPAGRLLPTWCRALGEATRHVLMEHAGNKGLIRHAFLKRLGLDVAQVTRRQADVDPPVLDGGGSGGRFDLGKLSLGSHRLEPPFLEGSENFELIRVSLWHQAHLGSSSLASPCGSG